MIKQAICRGTLFLAAAAAVIAAPRARAAVKDVVKLPALRNTLYHSNKAPLLPNPETHLPVGSIAPAGWLHHMLELEAHGMIGHLYQMHSYSPWLVYKGDGWTTPRGKGPGWEEVPYWLRGFGDLGYILHNKRILKETKKWINGVFRTQRPSGFFGPANTRREFNNKLPDMWPQMPMLEVLRSYYEYSHDPRVLRLFNRYFKFQLSKVPGKAFGMGWGDTRWSEELDVVYWYYNLTGKKWLLKLGKKINKNSANWAGGVASLHGVNFGEGFREPAEYYMQSHVLRFLQATSRDYHTMHNEYGQVPGGGYAADENVRPGYIGPRQGIETCAIVENMLSDEVLTQVTGRGNWADRCEDLAFNMLPSATSPNLKALHYLTAANQIQLGPNNRAPDINDSGTMFSYSPGGVFRCCQHNFSQGWPYYNNSLWMASGDNGLVADMYNACTVTGKVSPGVVVHIVEKTDYPFSGHVTMTVHTAKEARFPLYLRVPRWCRGATVSVNGRAVQVSAKPESYLRINHTWKNGDKVSLRLPMHIIVKRWKANDNSASVVYGPLWYSLDIGEKWIKYHPHGGKSPKAFPHWKVYPTTPWNYGLVLDKSDPAASFKVVRKPGPLAKQPFTPKTVPIELIATGRRIPHWTMNSLHMVGNLHTSPVISHQPKQKIVLIPLGAARLRISAFPVIGNGPGAHHWPKRAVLKAADYTPSASWKNPSDSLRAMENGYTPKSSAAQVARFTWWDHLGSREWVQYTFKKAKRVSQVKVYWFDDTGIGGCRVPRWWQLLYRKGGSWKHVRAKGAYGTRRNGYNTVNFAPVTTTALRIVAQLRDGRSGGILQWKVR